jgi:hypothetical protein
MYGITDKRGRKWPGGAAEILPELFIFGFPNGLLYIYPSKHFPLFPTVLPVPEDMRVQIQKERTFLIGRGVHKVQRHSKFTFHAELCTEFVP